MKFDNVVEMIEKPELSAYLAQIKAVQDKLKNATPEEKIVLNKQLQALRQQMNKMKQEQAKDLQKKQQELAKANTAV